MTDRESRVRKFGLIIVAYPVVLVLIGLGLNVFLFGIEPAAIALPAPAILWALVIAGTLLVLNHTWLMTATELTRLKYNMHASPEEWAENNARKEDVAEQGWIELDRHHNAHRNATENTVYFGVVAVIFSVVSPPVLAAQIWLVGFSVARLGYTFSALRGKPGLRGLFMSLSLLSLYGLTGYLVLSVVA